MKYYTSFFTIFLLYISISSCKKSFLNVEDNTAIIQQQYVTDLNSTQQFLNGIYVILGRDIFHSNYQLYPDLIADNIKPSTSNSSILLSHYNWSQILANYLNNRDELWRIGYQAIRCCNLVIDKASEYANENPAKAKQLQSEAYSIRALLHFLLVNTFAQSYNFSSNGNHPGVPYITKFDWTSPYSRNSVTEVYDGIITDLTTAISLFQLSPNNTLIMNQNAAKALLARIYLFKEEWQKAKQLAMEVTLAVPLMPSSDYPSKLFTLQETEALFQLAPSSTNVMAGSYNTNFVGYYCRGSNTRFVATKDIADLLIQDPNDSRKSWISSGGLGKDSIRKFPTNVVPGFATGPTDIANPTRSYYQTLIRSSEMFLTVAEAAVHTGEENTAQIYLDSIRKRANPTATNSTATGNALLDSIYLERRKELAFEGIRMFDLLRWKKGVNRIDVATGAPTTLPYPSNKALAPIPVVDVANGIPQNIGYN